MISCNEYDAIELLCIHHYPIKISIKNGEKVECIALDIQINTNQEECIQIKLKDTIKLEEDEVKLILLSDIVTITINIENPHFKVITFKRLP